MKCTLDSAQALHIQGRLSEAETQYREVLEWQPDAVEALRGLGALAYQHGRVDEAMDLFARCGDSAGGRRFPRQPGRGAAES